MIHRLPANGKEPLLPPVGTDIDSYKSPLVIVTAMVDQIDVRQAIIDPNRDLRMVGYVSWAGSTSMEITMKLQQQPEVQ